MIGIILLFVRDFADLGMPPGLHDSERLREWVAKLVAILNRGSTYTDTTIDDTLVAILHHMVASDDCWQNVHSLLHLLCNCEDPVTVVRSQHVAAVADEAGVDPLTVIAIIKAVLELLQWWRNR